MMKRISGAIAAGVVAFGMSSVSAEAQTAQQTRCVSAQTHWSVCIWENPKECWGVAAPRESLNTRNGRPTEVRRGDTMLFVAYRPGQGARGEVSFTPGYAYAAGSQVSVQIGNDKFTLYTDKEWAWPANPQEDAALLAAMRRGSEAVVTGQSSRGTDTKDTFSLMGFSAALQEAENRCK